MTIEAGEIREQNKPSKIAVYDGDVIVLEVHNEPRVDWTDEPTCLVKEGKQRPFAWTQKHLEETTHPALDDAGNRCFARAML